MNQVILVNLVILVVLVNLVVTMSFIIISFVEVSRKWRDHWVPLTLLSVNRNIKCKKKRGVL